MQFSIIYRGGVKRILNKPVRRVDVKSHVLARSGELLPCVRNVMCTVAERSNPPLVYTTKGTHTCEIVHYISVLITSAHCSRCHARSVMVE